MFSGLPTGREILSTSVKTSYPARTETSFRDWWIGAYNIGLNIKQETWLFKEEERSLSMAMIFSLEESVQCQLMRQLNVCLCQNFFMFDFLKFKLTWAIRMILRRWVYQHKCFLLSIHNIRLDGKKCQRQTCFFRLVQGMLTEGEGSVQLTSSLRWLVL